MELAADLPMTEFRERIIELIVESIPHLCRLGGVFDAREVLVGASHVDDRLGVVSSFTPVSLLGTAVPNVVYWFSLCSSNSLASICSHDYSPQFLSPHGVVVLGQFRNVGVIGLEGLGRHGSWWSLRLTRFVEDLCHRRRFRGSLWSTRFFGGRGKIERKKIGEFSE